MNSKSNAKILIIDNEADILRNAKLVLDEHFNMVHIENDPKNVINLLHIEKYDIILLNEDFSQKDKNDTEGFLWLKKILETNPFAIVILIEEYISIDKALQGIKEGASEFILKPWNDKKLIATINANLKAGFTKAETESTPSKTKSDDQTIDDHGIVSESLSMQKVLTLIKNAVKSDDNILITGENGTGKKFIAQLIHNISNRKDKAFINVDFNIIDETRFESELYGFVKGDFGDATEDYTGLIEAANNGTIFLNKINKLPLHLQTMLLNTLQNQKVARLGSEFEIPINIRIISASNIPIHQMGVKDKYNKSFINHLKTVEIKLPPLRSRAEDIPRLSEYFLNYYSKKYKTGFKKISSLTLDVLKKYNWPGNITELQHAVERAVIMSESNILEPHDFFLPQTDNKHIESTPPTSLNTETTEKALIVKTLEKYSNNIRKSAKKLGITPATLLRKIEKYGLE
ncbi:MAG: sigma-54-dependent Fis family transcriptional regulator [Bacteroidales bacterium]|jgi:DNA-binding NtrC family response regulator|nr:sigma-54-dependent Fis family transcriptional regulator [Bacteroidales bacterium]